jgi:FMN-dependent NADH-azoreductase
MSNLLHIAFNPAKEYSRTAKLAQAYLEKRQAKDPGLKIEVLDLTEADLPPIDMLAEMARRKTFGGIRYEADEETVWERVIRYCAQFIGADEIVLSCAMWNFSIPYKVKHYIDVIVQPRQTFAYTEQGPQGLCNGKPFTLITTRGSSYKDPPFDQFNFQSSYLRTVCGFIGCTYSEIAAEGLDMVGPDGAEDILKQVIATL